MPMLVRSIYTSSKNAKSRRVTKCTVCTAWVKALFSLHSCSAWLVYSKPLARKRWRSLLIEYFRSYNPLSTNFRSFWPNKSLHFHINFENISAKLEFVVFYLNSAHENLSALPAQNPFWYKKIEPQCFRENFSLYYLLYLFTLPAIMNEGK